MRAVQRESPSPALADAVLAERELKRGPARSVRLVATDGGARVIKRFEGRGPFSLARSRARREFRLLSALHAAGLRVPRPLALSGVRGGHEVAMEWFPQAVALQALLDGRGPWPIPPARLAAALARLLAELQARGLDHPDLHAGNVLVLPSGELAALDFHRARLRRRLSAEDLERHLVQLAAGTRESTPRAFRARFLRDWLGSLPSELAAGLPDRAALAARVEARARILRREVVRRRRARWMRAGTAVEPLSPGAGSSGWQRVGADGGRIAALAAGRPRAGELLLVPRSARAARALWLTAARLSEHRVASAAPLALCVAPRPWLALELPAGARRAFPGELPGARARLQAELARRGLAARLADGEIWFAPGGRPLIAGAGELHDA
jgi:tRNA A-37 threonylcarbamoyl transferase component Bud32